jgi:hypothetical protein
LRLAEAAAPLDHFDFVTVGVGDEEETRQRFAVMLEVAQRPGREAFALKSCVLDSDIIDDDGEMAVPIAKRIGLLTIEIDGQFDLEGRGGMTQIDQREILKLEVIGNFEAEGLGVESQRFRLVEHADHRVNRFAHQFSSLR